MRAALATLALALASLGMAQVSASTFANALANKIDDPIVACEIPLEGEDHACIRTWGDVDLGMLAVDSGLRSFSDVSAMTPWEIGEEGYASRLYGLTGDSGEVVAGYLVIVNYSLTHDNYAIIMVIRLEPDEG